ETAVVLVHGFASSKDHPLVIAAARALRDAGFSVLTYDGRGQGKSEGLCTLGDLERHDVGAAVAFARDHAAAVVVVGASMGAIAVLRHASDDPDLGGVVAVSSPALWRFPRNPRALLAAGLTRTPPGRLLAARWMGVRLAPRWSSAEAP